jgi:predicted transcriptional regulator
MRYRSRIKITIQILEAANGEKATRTKIMFKAFISHVQLQEYLKMLIEDGLLQYYPESRTFKTTTKGLMVLGAYNELDDMVKKEQKVQQKVQQQPTL